MTITLTNEPTIVSARYCGNGMYLTGTVSVFTPGDYMTASLADFIAGRSGGSGDNDLSSVNFILQLGWSNRQGTFNGITYGSLPDTDMELQLNHFDGSDALIESVTLPYFKHDPTTGLIGLFGAFETGAPRAGGHDPMLDMILAAVRRTFPPS